MDTKRQKYLVALLSVFSNGALVALKLIVGCIIGSVSVISEAIHSGVDVIAALAAFIGVKQAGEPADREHAFGHGKFESLSGMIQGVLIFVAAVWILCEGFIKLLHDKPMETIGVGVAVMFISSLVNAAVARILFMVGDKSDSLALKADAWHCLTDVYTSAGVMIGLGLVWLGKIFFPGTNLQWIDPVAAIIVALLIIKAAYDLTKQSLKDLLDVSLPKQEEDRIKDMLKSKYPDIKGFHKFRSRKSGADRFIEFHIFVDPQMPVVDTHKLHHAIAGDVKKSYPGTQVMVHIEPFDLSMKPKTTEYESVL